MKTTLRSAFLASLLLCSPLFAQTGVPQGISYQATITDETGAVIAPLPGPAIQYNITLRVFDAATGGTQKWAEVFNGVPVSNGRFSVVLGQGVAAPGATNPVDLATIFNEQDRFIEISVVPTAGGASKTFSPRQQLLASPTAMRAKVAEVAQTIVSGAVNTDQLATGSITNAKLADLSITADKIAPDSVKSSAIANNSVQTGKLVDGSVTTLKLADGSVTNVKLADASVTNVKLADGSVQTAKLADGSVTNAKLGDNAVNSVKIQDGSIQKSDLAPGVGVTLTMVSHTARGLSTRTTNFDGGGVAVGGAIARRTTTLDAASFDLPSEGVNGLYLRVWMHKRGYEFTVFLPDGTKDANGLFNIPLNASQAGAETLPPWKVAPVSTYPMAVGLGDWFESVFCPVRKDGNTYRFEWAAINDDDWNQVPFEVNFQILGYY